MAILHVARKDAWVWVVMLVVLVVGYNMEGGVVVARGGDPCPEGMGSAAMELVSCLPATKDGRASVAPACCSQITQMMEKPDCLCGVLTTPFAKSMGVNPIVALSIPKRCAIASRPVGYKCAGGVVP